MNSAHQVSTAREFPLEFEVPHELRRLETKVKIILTHDVPKLGAIGTVVNVKNGYARNYLIPRSFGVPANEENQKELEHHKRVLAAKREKLLKEVKGVAAKIEKLSVTVPKKVGEDERIFGSVTTAEIANMLEGNGLQISKKDIRLTEEIKKVGVYSAEVHLHSEVTAKLKVWVVAE